MAHSTNSQSIQHEPNKQQAVNNPSYTLKLNTKAARRSRNVLSGKLLMVLNEQQCQT